MSSSAVQPVQVHSSVAVEVAHRLGRLQRAAADEHGQAREQPLLAGVQQVGSSSRSWLRSVCWRAGRSRAPPVSSGRRCCQPRQQRLGREQLDCAPPPVRSPAAARPGGGRSPPPPARSPSVIAKSGLTAWARSMNSAHRRVLRAAARAGGRRSGVGQRQRRHRDTPARPETCSGARLVTSTFSRGQAASSSANGGAAGSTCSKLSSSKQQLLVAHDRLQRLQRLAGPRPLEPRARWAMAEATRPGRRSGRDRRRPDAVGEAPRAARPPPAAPGASCPCRPVRSASASAAPRDAQQRCDRR